MAEQAPPGVLAGGVTVRVNENGVARYYQVYQVVPGSGQFVAYQFSGYPQARATFGENLNVQAWTPQNFRNRVLAESQAEEVIGLEGNWTALVTETIRDAAAAAGVRDPGLVGQMASNPEMQRIMALATMGEWTSEQIQAEQRKTSFWQNTLYPGIKAFYGRTTEPEKAWANYVDTVSPSLTQLGYQKAADGTYKNQVGKMLDLGIDAQVWAENVPVFQQAQQNAKYWAVLRDRAQLELGKTVTFRDWFGLLKGEAAPEIAKVAEGATLAYEAQQSGLGLQENMLQRLIAERDFSDAEARNVFSEVNQAVLALGEQGLKRGALSRDDIISSMAGIQSATGLDPDAVRLKVAKLARENDLFDDEKLQFYVGFSPSGTPTRPGLQALAPQGA